MRRRPSSFRRNARGFTLLELLVATAVGAMVLLVINTTFFGALKLHNSTHDKIDRDLEIQRALEIVRKDLAGIQLPPASTTTTTTTTTSSSSSPSTATTLSGQFQTTDYGNSIVQDVSGDRISPDIYTNTGKIDGWTTFGDVQMVTYFLTPATNGTDTKNLVRVVNRNLLSYLDDDEGEQQILISGVANADMLYFDGNDWQTDWDSTVTTSLPSAIKFQLQMASTTPGLQPGSPIELIVPIDVMTTATSTADAAVAPTNPNSNSNSSSP